MSKTKSEPLSIYQFNCKKQSQKDWDVCGILNTEYGILNTIYGFWLFFPAEVCFDKTIYIAVHYRIHIACFIPGTVIFY